VVANLHGDFGFLRTSSAPENQGEEREKNKKAQNESKDIAAAREGFLALLIFKEALFLDDITLLP